MSAFLARRTIHIPADTIEHPESDYVGLKGSDNKYAFLFLPNKPGVYVRRYVFHAEGVGISFGVILRYVCVTCAKCKSGDFFNCTRQKEYCGEWEHYDFEQSWSAKVRHIKKHLVAHAGLSVTKDPTMKDIHSYLQKQFPDEEIPKITRRVVALDLWQYYSQRFP